MEYSKGEWAIGLDSNEERTQVITQDGQHLCYVEQDPHLANAQLIASAPKLYEALREICRRYDEDGILDISPARKALAKAEGK